VVIAHHFGSGAQTDAFFVAFKIPNFFRRLFAEGAFSQAFVPVLAEYKAKCSPAEVKELVNSVSGTLTVALGSFSIFAVLFTPVLIFVFAPGYIDKPDQMQLASSMLQITFPYLLLISLTAFSSSILNSYRQFTVPAVTPCLMNVVLIIATIYLTPYFHQPAVGLAWGVLIAGIAQWVFQMPFLARIDLLPKPKFNFHHEGVKKILTLMIPALFGVSVGQINLFVDNMVATFLQPGSVSWLWYSDRVTELPIGLVGIAIGTVILPSLSDLHSKSSSREFSATIDWGLRLVFLMGIPAGLAMMVIAEPLLVTIFDHGKMTGDDVIMAAQSLRAYSVGVIGFMLVKILAPGFYARQDTRSPVRIGIIAVLANLILIGLFVTYLKHAGIALATSLAQLLNSVLLYKGLRKLGVYQPEPGWGKLLLRYVIANTVMGVVLYLLMGNVAQWFAWSTWQRVWELTILCSAGVVVYFMVLWLMGLRVHQFKQHVE
jgi:putative peptidoglycan lipid II flippase